MSLDEKTPIGKVAPGDGIAYLAGYKGAGNNPAMFAEYDEGQGVKLHVAGSVSLDAFAIEAFDEAVAHFRERLQRQSYKPSNENAAPLARTHDPQRLDPQKPVGDVVIGDGMSYFSGRTGPHNTPTIYAHGSSKGDRLTVVGPNYLEEFSIKAFPAAIARFKGLVDFSAKRQPAKAASGCLSVFIAASLLALALHLLI